MRRSWRGSARLLSLPLTIKWTGNKRILCLPVRITLFKSSRHFEQQTSANKPCYSKLGRLERFRKEECALAWAQIIRLHSQIKRMQNYQIISENHASSVKYVQTSNRKMMKSFQTNFFFFCFSDICLWCTFIPCHLIGSLFSAFEMASFGTTGTVYKWRIPKFESALRPINMSALRPLNLTSRYESLILSESGRYNETSSDSFGLNDPSVSFKLLASIHGAQVAEDDYTVEGFRVVVRMLRVDGRPCLKLKVKCWVEGNDGQKYQEKPGILCFVLTV